MPKSIGTTASPSQAGRGTLRSMPVSVSSNTNTGNAGDLVKVSEDINTVKYRPRLDTKFSEISYNKTIKTWLICEANGINHTLGEGVASQIISPDGQKIYQW